MREKFPHETEVVTLVSPERRHVYDLELLLEEAGFVRTQWVWQLPRRDEAKKWQVGHNGSVRIFFAGEQLDFYDEPLEGEFTDEERESMRDDEWEEQLYYWDRLEIRYPMASLPEASIDPLAEAAGVLAAGLQLPLIYQDQEVSAEELAATWHSYCAGLEKEFGGVGSMTIRHFIDLHYS
ncbi:hypothetical protein EON80_18400 [bacterium]|nr:MAG: hypothetical protein EON80_18400 [bacterium]